MTPVVRLRWGTLEAAALHAQITVQSSLLACMVEP